MASPWASLLNVPGYADLLDIDEEGRRFGRIYAVGIGDIASAGPVFHTSKIGSITLKVKFFSFDLSNQKIYHNNLFIRDSDRVGYVSYMEVNVAEDGDGLISMKRMLPVSETAPEQSEAERIKLHMEVSLRQENITFAKFTTLIDIWYAAH